MVAAVDRFLSVVPPTPDEDIDRYQFLDDCLQNFGFYGDYIQIFQWYNDYQAHGVYPFGRGTWEDQPEWLHRDFTTLALKQEHAELRKTLETRNKKGA